MKWDTLIGDAPLIAGALTFLSLVVAGWGLFALHAWNRRNTALQLIADWNPRTIDHRRAFERAYPGCIDFHQGTAPAKEFTKAEAVKIYTADPDTPEWALRFHVVELANFLEYVSLAYIHHTANREMIRQALSHPMKQWHKLLEPFFDVVIERRSYHLWQPYDDLVRNHLARVPSISGSRPLP